jgi:hypothetical protein
MDAEYSVIVPPCVSAQPRQREAPSDTFPQCLLALVPGPILDGSSLYVLGGCALILVAWVCARGLPRVLKRTTDALGHARFSGTSDGQ